MNIYLLCNYNIVNFVQNFVLEHPVFLNNISNYFPDASKCNIRFYNLCWKVPPFLFFTLFFGGLPTGHSLQFINFSFCYVLLFFCSVVTLLFT